MTRRRKRETAAAETVPAPNVPMHEVVGVPAKPVVPAARHYRGQSGGRGAVAICGGTGHLVGHWGLVDCPACLAARPAMGPKPRAGATARNRSVRATDAEWAAWQAAAGRRPVSDWVREVANEAAEVKP